MATKRRRTKKKKTTMGKTKYKVIWLSRTKNKIMERTFDSKEKAEEWAEWLDRKFLTEPYLIKRVRR